jgi:nicotinamidase-related amidase
VTAPTQARGRGCTLLLVDLQNDYFADDELARCRDDLVDRANLLIDRADTEGATVVEVRTVHAADRSTWALNMLEDGHGVAIEGTPGAQRLPGLRRVDETVVKTRDSAFFGTGLRARLAELGSDRVVLAGVSTESCIAATASDAYAGDLRAVIVSDATASVRWACHTETLDRLSRQYRQRVTTATDADVFAVT